MKIKSDQLISYIAPAAPATRRPGIGNEPFLRPEIGFTPKWYQHSLNINFDEKWHTDPAFRHETNFKYERRITSPFSRYKNCSY